MLGVIDMHAHCHLVLVATNAYTLCTWSWHLATQMSHTLSNLDVHCR